MTRWVNHKVHNLPSGALSAICVDGRQSVNSTRFRHVFVYLLIIMAVIVILTWAIKPANESQSVGISRVAEEARDGHIKSIVVYNNSEMKVTLKSGSELDVKKDPTSGAPEQLAALGVTPEQMSAIEWSNEEAFNLGV